MPGGVVSPRLAAIMNLPKYAQVAETIRAQIADGKLTPGQPAPSGAALARMTGYSTLTCRRALRTLIKDGVLVPGTSPNARPRVRVRATRREQTRADAARALSASIARHRHAAGLTQPQLAVLVGVSVTTIGHAETGRLWQSRDFWQRADKSLNAAGELLSLHDAYRAASSVPAVLGDTTAALPGIQPALARAEVGTTAAAIPGPVACVTIIWNDGKKTTVYPPGLAADGFGPGGRVQEAVESDDYGGALVV
jgi:DNA-binding transcriptional regulator YhcF (GntR family)